MNAEQQALVYAAQGAHGAGRVEEALGLFLRAAELNAPGEVYAYDMAGHCYAALSRSVEAVKAYKIFVEKERNSDAVWSNLGAFSFNHGDFSYAAKCMAEVLRLKGPSRDGMLLRFLGLYYAGEDEPIPDLLFEYLDLYSNDYANTEKFLEYVKSNPSIERRDKAMEMYLSAGKHLLGMVLTVARYYRSTNRLPRAIEVIEDYLRSKVRILQTEVAEGYASLGELYLLSNDIPRAIARLQRGMERVRNIKDAGRVAYCLGHAHSRNGDFALAADFNRAASNQYPDYRYRLIRTSFAA